MAWPVSAAYLAALRYPHRRLVRAVPQLGSTVLTVPGWADGLPISGGTVQVDSTSRSRRTLNATIGDPTLAPQTVTDILAVQGVEFQVNVGVQFPDGSSEYCPVGLFHIEEVDWSAAGITEISLSSIPDRGALVTDDRFPSAQASTAGTVVGNISTLLLDAIPAGSPHRTVVDATGNGASCPAMQWTDSDRWAAISQLEDAIGAEAFFDAAGSPTIRNVATTADPPVWTVDAGPSGVMIDGSVKAGRAVSSNAGAGGTYNAVVVTGERTDGTTPVWVMVTDNDSTSPTYWGGPFGHKPRFYTSPLITDATAALATANALLAKVTGWTRVLDLTNVPNPALEASDVIEVVFPDGAVEYHIIDSMTIPLGPGDAQTIETRTLTLPAES